MQIKFDENSSENNAKNTVLHQLYIYVLHRYCGNLTKGAEYLGIIPRTFRKEVKNSQELTKIRESYRALETQSQTKVTKPRKYKSHGTGTLPKDVEQLPCEVELIKNQLKVLNVENITEDKKLEYIFRVINNITDNTCIVDKYLDYFLAIVDNKVH